MCQGLWQVCGLTLRACGFGRQRLWLGSHARELFSKLKVQPGSPVRSIDVGTLVAVEGAHDHCGACGRSGFHEPHTSAYIMQASKALHLSVLQIHPTWDLLSGILSCSCRSTSSM